MKIAVKSKPQSRAVRSEMAGGASVNQAMLVDDRVKSGWCQGMESQMQKLDIVLQAGVYRLAVWPEIVVFHAPE